jgi:hypothetical protein
LAHPGRPALVVVVDELVGDLVGEQRHVAGAFGRRQRRRHAAEVAAVGTATDAEIAVLAGAALRAFLVRERRGEIGGAPDDELAADLLRDALLEVELDAVELHGRQEFSIGQRRNTFLTAADARESFHVVVPRRDLVVAHRPRDADPLFRIRFEIHRAEAITLPRPHE